MIFEQFDIVRIINPGRVSFLSGPRGTKPSPSGYWSVVGAVMGELVIAKDNTIVKIPLDDVVKVGRYDYVSILKSIEQAGLPRSENGEVEAEEK